MDVLMEMCRTSCETIRLHSIRNPKLTRNKTIASRTNETWERIHRYLLSSSIERGLVLASLRELQQDVERERKDVRKRIRCFIVARLESYRHGRRVRLPRRIRYSSEILPVLGAILDGLC